MFIPTKSELQQIKDSYPIGCRVELVEMGDDPCSKLKPGDQGTVCHIDDAGTVFVNWDCGSGLGMVFRVDVIRRI